MLYLCKRVLYVKLSDMYVCVLRERTLMLSGGLVSLQPQHTNVCFWYLPPGVRYLEDKVEKMKRLHKVRKIRFNQWM